ncbi:MAG: tetratricopeptide repeat protein [Planctomycetes bacterium]|nr:tetratricopeptide repeat protein [Planctomycetota bacterium]
MDENKFTKRLLKKGLISKEQIQEAVDEQEKSIKEGSKKPISRILIDKGFISINKLSQELQEVDEADHAAANEPFLQPHSGLGEGKYDVLNEIGSGGMGTVYKAFDKSLKRNVALKFLDRVSDKATKRFSREAEIISKLNHPNIVPIYEIGSFKDKYFIAMQYLDGATLDKIIGKLPIRGFVEIIIKICEAVEHAHSKGIIHRDIKPQNIIIVDNKSVFITDFGLAKQLDTDLTLTESVMGTPGYIPPEQALGFDVDIRSDIYSIGATLYHCTTGSNPFAENNPLEAVLKAVDNEPSPPSKLNPLIPSDLEIIIQKCLHSDSNLRYQTAKELRQDLQRFLGGEPVHAKRLTAWYIISKKIKKFRTHILIGIGAIIVTSIALLLLNRENPTILAENLVFQGMKAVNSKQYKEAEDLLIKAIDLDPKQFNAHYNLAIAYMELGKINEAINSLMEATKLQPGMKETREVKRKLAYAYYLQKNYKEANKLMEEMYAKFPDDSDLLLDFGIFKYSIGETEKAIELLKKGIELKPSHAEAHNYLGKIYNNNGKYEEAMACFKKASELKPEYVEPLLNRGIMHLQLQQPDKALKSLRQALEIKRDSSDIYYNLGIAYDMLKMRDESVTSYNACIRLNPEHYQAHYNLGVIYTVLNDKKSAKKQYKILKTLHKESADMLKRVIDQYFPDSK